MITNGGNWPKVAIVPQKLVWTDQRDAQLKRMRAQGGTWDAIADALGISRNAAIERGRRVGARLPPREHIPEPEDPERSAFPPGHRVTWGAIVAGTCLAGSAYPLPMPWVDTPLTGAAQAVMAATISSGSL